MLSQYDFSERPGVKASALLGDVCLLKGNIAFAKQIYLEAWKSCDVAALTGYIALCAREGDLPNAAELAQDLLSRIKAGDIDRVTGEVLLRLMVAELVWGCDAKEAGAAIARAGVRVLPKLSSPALFASGFEGEEGGLDGLWSLAQQVPEGALRSYLVLRHHQLAAIQGNVRAQIFWVGPGAEGATQYLCLRALDTVMEWPTAHGQTWRESVRCDVALDAAEVTSLFSQTLMRIEDAGERLAYKARLMEWRFATEAVDSLEGLLDEVLQEGQGGSSVGVLEKLQRLSVARGDWKRASSTALIRAGKLSNSAQRVGLLLLAMEYLRLDGGCADVLHEIAKQVVRPENGVGGYPSAVNHLCFEILEGVLIADGDHERLRELWSASKDAQVLKGESGGLERYPSRWLEAVVLDGVSKFSEQVEKCVDKRHCFRWLLVRGMLECPRQELEAVLSEHVREDAAQVYSLMVVGEENHTEHETALANLRGQIKEASGADLTMFHVWWIGGGMHAPDSLAVLEARLEGVDSELGSAVRSQASRDLLASGEMEKALSCARKAFRLNPFDDDVRAALREVAEAADSKEALSELGGVLDDQEMTRQLKGSDQRLGEMLAQVERWSEGDEGARELAISALEKMALEVESAGLRSAMLRRAAQLARGMEQPQRAVNLSKSALEQGTGDVLALRLGLEVMLEGERYDEVSLLLKDMEAGFVLSEVMAERLFVGGDALVEDGAPAKAQVLYRAVVENLREQCLDGVFGHALARLEVLSIEGGEVCLWRDLLESLLIMAEKGVVGSLHLRLGRIYEEHLSDHDLAIAHYKQALLGSESRGAALNALEKIYGAMARYGDLAMVLRGQVEEAIEEGCGSGSARLRAHQEVLAAVLSERLGEKMEARSIYRDLLSSEPRDLKVLMKVVELDRELGDSASLVSTLERASRLVEGQDERSEMYFETGQVYEKALNNVQRALENYMVSFICDNSNQKTFARLEVLYHELGRWKDLLGIYDVAIDAVRRNVESEFVLEALYDRKAQIEFFQLDRPVQAAGSFLNALKQNPGEERYLHLMEVIGKEESIPKLLLQAYRLRINAFKRLDPIRRPLMHRLASLLRYQGREDDAIQVYQELLAEWPGDDIGSTRLEAIFRETERWLALVDFYQVRIRTASCAEEMVPLCWSIAKVAERKLRDMELALETYESLLELEPENIEVLQALGRLLEATRRWERLIEVSEREVELATSSKLKAHIYFRIGSIFETVHQNQEKAIASYKQSIRHDPRSAPALHGLREIYRRQGEWEAVLETFEQEVVLWRKPQERASVFTMMAEIYIEKLKAPEEGELLLKEALELTKGGATRAAEMLLELYVAAERWREAAPLVKLRMSTVESLTSDARTRLYLLQARVTTCLGRDKEARESLRLALDSESDDSPARSSTLSMLLDEIERIHERWGVAEGDVEEHQAFLDRFEQELCAYGDVKDQVRLYVLKGQEEEAKCRLEQAERYYRKATSSQPLEPGAHQPLVRLMIRQRRFEAALGQWLTLRDALRDEEGCVSDPGRSRSAMVEVCVSLGELYMNWLNQPTLAGRCFEDARALDGQNLDLLWASAQCDYLLKRWPSAHETMRELITLEESRGCEGARLSARYFYLGRILDVGFGDADGALVAFGKARLLNRRDLRSVHGATQALMRQEDWLGVESYLKGELRVVEQDLSLRQILPLKMTLAESYVRQGRHDEATAAYVSVLNSSPPGALVHDVRMALSKLQMTSGRLEGAVREVNLLLDEEPLHEAGLLQAARLYEKLGQEARRYRVSRVLEAFGMADGRVKTWLAMCHSHSPWWLQPLRGEMTAELRGISDGQERRWPEWDALRRLGPILGKMFPEDPLCEGEVTSLAYPEEIELLRERMGVSEEVQAKVRFVRSQVVGLRFSKGGLAVVSVGEGRPWREIQFLVAQALEILHRGLSIMSALKTDELAKVVELVVRLQEGEAIEGLRREPLLRGLVRRMNQSDVETLKRAAMDMTVSARPLGDDSGGAKERAEELQETLSAMSKRIALLMVGDISRVLRGNSEVGRRSRGSAAEQDLLRFYISERYAIIRGHLNSVRG